jgi:Cofilin/tropomyosin-type actin-binding protein
MHIKAIVLICANSFLLENKILVIKLVIIFIFLLSVKVDRAKQCICVDEVLEGISVDELRESLPSHQPRYVIYSYKMEHSDGRISFPMCFIYITPRGTFFGPIFTECNKFIS